LVALRSQWRGEAMVGGRNYADSQFNRAGRGQTPAWVVIQALRLSRGAGEGGLLPDTVRDDAPISVKGWSPENYSREYFGPVTLTKALALSLNTVAVRLGQEVGPKAVVEVAHRLGITSDLDPVPSIALGSSDVTPLEMVSAYAASRMAPGRPAACDRPRSHGERQAALRAAQRKFRTRHRPPICGDDEPDDAGDAAGPEPRAMPNCRAGRPRANRDQPGLARRLVSWLHELSGRWSLGSATTTARQQRKCLAAICRSKSGAGS